MFILFKRFRFKIKLFIQSICKKTYSMSIIENNYEEIGILDPLIKPTFHN